MKAGKAKTSLSSQSAAYFSFRTFFIAIIGTVSIFVFSF